MRRIATIVALLAMTAGAWAAQVRLLDATAVDHDLVLLSDVASIEGAGAAERSRLAKVAVGYVGDGAASAVVDADGVRTALANAGVNLSNVTLSGAMAARVMKAHDGGGTKWALACAQTYLKGVDAAASYTVSDARPDFALKAPATPVIVAANVTGVSGLTRFDVADASDLSKVIGHVLADVTRSVRTVVARRRIPGGQVLASGDLEVKWISDREAAGAMSSADLAVGRRLLLTVEAGRPLLAKNLKNENAIKRGDAVTLSYTDGALTIVIRTIAMQDAGDGDHVRLRRAGGTTEQIGKVVGPGKAVPVTGEQQ